MEVSFYTLSFVTKLLVPVLIGALAVYFVHKKHYKLAAAVVVIAVVIGSFINFNHNDSSSAYKERVKGHHDSRAQELPPKVVREKKSLEQILAEDSKANKESYKRRLEDNPETKTKEDKNEEDQ